MAGMELKRCPFCGGYAKYATIGTTVRGYEVGMKFVIKCERCGVRIPNMGEREVRVEMKETGELVLTKDERVEAANDWNRRGG